MIENIVEIKLAADEVLTIKRNSLCSVNPETEKRVAIVTGIHGDELEGQYICYELVKRITANMQHLKGRVDIYPAINPLGIESACREIPTSALDMNRVFSAPDPASISEKVAAAVVADIKGASVCVDIHASNIFIREIPQVRILPRDSDYLMRYAKMLNTDLVWVHESGAVGGGSLAEALINEGVPTLAVEMGVGGRISVLYCEQVLHSIFNLMNNLGVWAEPEHGISHPMISSDGEVHVVHASDAGVFIPHVEHNMWLSKGSEIGEIVTPITGTVVQKITAPESGVIFSLREYPIVSEGSTIARMLSMGSM